MGWLAEIIAGFDDRRPPVYKDFELHEWLQNIGYVSQEVTLFKGTLWRT